MLTAGTKIACVGCAVDNACEVRIDKKGKPYLKCGHCSSIFFLRGPGWRGPEKFWGKLSMAVRSGQDEAAREILRRETIDGTVPSASV